MEKASHLNSQERSQTIVIWSIAVIFTQFYSLASEKGGPMSYTIKYTIAIKWKCNNT